MKKSTAFLLLFLCCFGCFGFGCGGNQKTTTVTTETPRIETPVSEFEYEVKKDYVNITKYKGTAEDVVIPARIEGLPVTGIGGFQNNTVVKTVIVSEGAKTIGYGAFENCTSIQKIDLSASSMEYIFQKAFRNCTNLTEVIFGDRIWDIESYAFENCTSLKAADLPKNLEKLEEYAFYNCTALESVTIPSTITIWEQVAFLNCSSIKEITITDGLQKLGGYLTFAPCNVKRLIVPKSVTYIETTFIYCDPDDPIKYPMMESVLFLGDAPECGNDPFGENPQLKVYYMPNTQGWDTTELRDFYTVLPYDGNVEDFLGK